MCRAVSPADILAFTSAPAAMSIRATSVWPREAATYKGVLPLPSRALMSAPPDSSAWTCRASPSLTAWCSGGPLPCGFRLHPAPATAAATIRQMNLLNLTRRLPSKNTAFQRESSSRPPTNVHPRLSHSACVVSLQRPPHHNRHARRPKQRRSVSVRMECMRRLRRDGFTGFLPDPGAREPSRDAEALGKAGVPWVPKRYRSRFGTYITAPHHPSPDPSWASQTRTIAFGSPFSPPPDQSPTSEGPGRSISRIELPSTSSLPATCRHAAKAAYHARCPPLLTAGRVPN